MCQKEPTVADLAEVLEVARRTGRARYLADHEVDDVAQATAIKLWLGWNRPHIIAARGRGQRAWRSYLARTAHNVYLDFVRSHQRRIVRERRSSPVHEQLLPERPSTRPAVVPNDAADIEAALARAWISGLIDTLPPRQRAVAHLVFVHSFTSSEAASYLGIQQQTVNMHLRKGRAAIQERLRDDDLSSSGTAVDD